MNANAALAFDGTSLAGTEFDCACGMHHRNLTDRVTVGRGIDTLAADIDRLGFAVGTCVLVCDAITFGIAGSRVEAELSEHGWNVHVSHLDRVSSNPDKVRADEQSIGALLLDLPRDAILLVAVGSGTVTDVTRFVGSRVGLPFATVPTAPSVDAYTSSTSPVTRAGHKESVWGTQAKLVAAETRILCEAPRAMIAAGLGDTVGKLVARCDWRLANLVTGEHFCAEIESVVTESVRAAATSAKAIGAAEPSAIAGLMKSLTISGAAMAMVDNSRPASGSEHMVSHYMEMKALQAGEKGLLHGTQVGIGAVLTSILWKRFGARLAQSDPDLIDPGDVWAHRRTAQEIGSFLNVAFGPAAKDIFTSVTADRIGTREQADNRVAAVKKHWSDLLELADEAPQTDEIATTLRDAGGPAYPADVGFGADEVRNMLLGACEVRARASVLTVCDDLGWLPELVDEVVEIVR